MTKIEEVAAAISASFMRGEATPEAFARAAIAAMREPTKAMTEIPWDHEMSFAEIWRGMTDAALKETP